MSYIVDEHLNEAQEAALSLNSAERIEQQKKHYTYYSGDKEGLRAYLKAALQKMYSDESIENMLFSYFNLTRKIIHQLTVVYKKPAKRFVMVDGKIDKKLTDLYNNLLPKNVNKADKRAYRLAKLHNTALPYLYFDAKSKRFKQATYSSWLYNVESENGETLDYISYARYVDGVLLDYQYTADEIKAVDSTGNEYTVGNLKDTRNPFGAIPFIVFRIDDSEDFWGVGADILVEANEEINFLLTKLTRDDIVMGTSGILFGTNLGDIITDNSDGQRKLKAGRGAIVNVDMPNNPTAATPDLKYVSTNPQISEVLKAIDWKIRAVALSFGLNPNSFSVENKVESGFSRLVARFEQSEVRIEDLEACYQYEQDRFDLIKTMYNSMVDEGYDVPFKVKFPEDAALMVDFQEIEIPATTTDLWHDRNMKVRYGMEKPVDWLVKENPDLTKEQAQKQIDENLAEYEKYINRFPNEKIVSNLNNNKE